MRAARTALQIYNTQEENLEAKICKYQKKIYYLYFMIKNKLDTNRSSLLIETTITAYSEIAIAFTWWCCHKVNKYKWHSLFPLSMQCKILSPKNKHTRPLWAGSWWWSPIIWISTIPKFFYMYLQRPGKNMKKKTPKTRQNSNIDIVKVLKHQCTKDSRKKMDWHLVDDNHNQAENFNFSWTSTNNCIWERYNCLKSLTKHFSYTIYKCI